MTWTRRAAEAGHVEAQYTLGTCLQGTGIAADELQAVTLIRRAAVKGNLAAVRAMGMCLLTGRGVAVDARQAVAWFRQAAEAGNSDAQHDLSLCYQRGTGVAVDHKQGVSWMHRAMKSEMKPEAGTGDLASALRVGIVLKLKFA